jgi:transcription elongation factor Elf1
MDNQTADRVLVKYWCTDCAYTFLVSGTHVKVKHRFVNLKCPMCGDTAQAVAHSNLKDDMEDILDGCLWPSWEGDGDGQPKG